MTTVELRFLAHRYHATAWGRHVNEGVPEWPPSPYRLLRALYDAWKRKCSHLSEAQVHGVLAALGAEPPQFQLPKAVASHTRSYLSSNTFDPTDKSLVFDAFVALPPEKPCYCVWDVALDSAQQEILEELLRSLNYLGRSESWIEAKLVNGSWKTNCLAQPDGETQVACAVAPQEYAGKRPWMDALAYSTSELLKEKRSNPPAMRTVSYKLEGGGPTPWLPVKRAGSKENVSGVVLTLGGRVLPPGTETIRVAERLRAALLSKARTPSGILHGKDDDGNPATGHGHLFMLPQTAHDGRIRRILLFARTPFSNEDLTAIRALRRLHQFEDDPLAVVVTWAGILDDNGFRPGSKTVVSTTPFIPVRHWRKSRGEMGDFVIDEVRRECANHGLPAPVLVTRLERLQNVFQPVHFRRNRKDDPPRPGYAFRIEFPTEVPAPYSLGYGCHFGLGQFDRPA